MSRHNVKEVLSGPNARYSYVIEVFIILRISKVTSHFW